MTLLTFQKHTRILLAAMTLLWAVVVFGLSSASASTPIGAPLYGGSLRNGNTYTISFTAPPDSSTKEVHVYSSQTAKFNADESTLVGIVSVKPAQSATLTYTASDENQRYTAVQAFDFAGNSSDLVGDPNISVVNPDSDDQKSNSTNGTVDANGSSAVTKSSKTAEVKSDSTQKPALTTANTSDSRLAWAIIIILVALAISYINRQKLNNVYERMRGGQES